MRKVSHNFKLMLALSLVLFSLPAFVLLYILTPYGLGITPDSINYIAAGRSFGNSGDFIGFEGDALTHWPPLFPIILWACGLLGDAPYSMQYVHCIVLGLISLVAFCFTYSATKSTAASFGAGLLVGLGSPLISVSTKLWSEPIFCLLAISAIAILVRYIKSANYYLLIALGLICALAFLQRYSGITLVISSVIVILLCLRSSINLKLVNITIFGVISCVPVGLWILRNFLMNATFSGERFYSVDKIIPSIEAAFTQLGSFIVPDIEWDIYSLIIGGGIFLYAWFIIIREVLSRNSSAAPDVVAVILSIYIVIYTMFIVYALLTACCAARFFAPLYPAVIMFSIISLRKAVCLLKSYDNNEKLLICLFFALLFLGVLHAIATYNYASSVKEVRYGLSWKNNNVLTFVRGMDDKKDICAFSNGPELVYFYSEVSCVKRAGEKKPYYHDVDIDTREKVFAQIRASEKNVIFVWFERLSESRFYTIDSLKKHFSVTLLFSSNQGAVYSVSSNN